MLAGSGFPGSILDIGFLWSAGVLHTYMCMYIRTVQIKFGVREIDGEGCRLTILEEVVEPEESATGQPHHAATTPCLIITDHGKP